MQAVASILLVEVAHQWTSEIDFRFESTEDTRRVGWALRR